MPSLNIQQVLWETLLKRTKRLVKIIFIIANANVILVVQIKS